MASLALESTVIAHGLPYPQNLATARELEAIARAERVEPKTIAILDGHVRIGLTPEQLEYLASPHQIMKVSRRDLAVALALKHSGATTVSATMFLAYKAGIRVFATGGIGGVHRGTAWDVSADLHELAHTRVAVVCAGAKAILDLPRTLEWLETFGVPVLGYQTDEFPAFYSRSSGLRVSARVASVDEAARVIYRHWELGLHSGVLVCVPIPARDEIPREQIEPLIERALEEAERQQVQGAAITPFVLARLAELTDGASIRANIALLKNNVTVAAQIARRLELHSQALA